MKKKYNFVYLTTNLITNKQYIGDHSCDNLEEDKYLGSGKKLLWPAIKKYGKQNFSRVILEFFNTKEEAFNAQEKYIKLYNTLTPNGYNISLTGGFEPRKIYSQSEETKEKIRRSKLGKISPMKGKRMPEEAKKKISQKNFGKKRSDEARRRYSAAKLGKPSGMKGKRMPEEAKKKISESAKLRIGEKNPFFGKKHTEESKQKMKDAKKDENNP